MPVPNVRRLDLRGLKCPLPAMRTRKALTRMAAGEDLVVEATDPMAAIDIPHMTSQTGDTLLDTQRDGDLLRFVIRKGPAKAVD